jgi:hypothetical protein
VKFAILLIAYFGIYFLLNVARLARGHSRPEYLHPAFLRTSEWLASLILLIAVLTGVMAANYVNMLTWLYILAGGQLLAALIILFSTLRHIRTTAPVPLTENLADIDLPTLSVCIPARNETDDLEACLQSLIASTYPKLEILVLDDCSQNKRTPEIIRDFAQAGVRFIAGQAPPEQWLAKNYAYHQLAEEANGEFLLFCGVDSRFEPDSLTNLIRLMLQKRKTMASIMPRNVLTNRWGLKTLLIQPARYAWELALPRRLLKRPPVLSTCWLIKRQTLEAAGGFAAVTRKSVPESYFARSAAAEDDSYTFVRSTPEISVASAKSFAEQKATAIRTRYPQLHRRPELVALTGLAEFAVLVGPLLVATVALTKGEPWLFGLGLLAYLIQSYVYGRVVGLAYRQSVPLGFLVLPLAAAYDLWLLNYSLWQYEFGEVIWKGRNACVPVMQVISKLPRPD